MTEYPTKKRLSLAEHRLLRRLWDDFDELVPSTELYKALRDDLRVELSSFNAHVRVKIHALRRKLAGSNIVVFSKPYGGYGVTVRESR